MSRIVIEPTIDQWTSVEFDLMLLIRVNAGATGEQICRIVGEQIAGDNSTVELREAWETVAIDALADLHRRGLAVDVVDVMVATQKMYEECPDIHGSQPI